MSIKSILSLSLLVIHISAMASDDITDAMNRAYQPYRVALFKTNSGSADDATKAIEQAQKRWGELQDKYAGKAVAPYDRDTKFSESLTAVASVYQQAHQYANEQKLHEAHEALENIREITAQLRHRNQVITYSDHMNAYHEQMEALLELVKEHAEQPDLLAQITMKTGVIVFLSNRLETEADKGRKADPEFGKLLMKQKQAIETLKTAVLNHDLNQIKAAINGLKPAYSKLFVKFG